MVSRFNAAERTLIQRMRTPEDVQRWLHTMPYNREASGETLRTFRGVVRNSTAHCLEAALAAATILEEHGKPPLLLDLLSVDDLDHVVFLFERGGLWGSVGRSRDPGLHGRKPIFKRVRDLVYSYFDPFIDNSGRINGYGVRDLRDVDALGIDWRSSGEDANWAIQEFLIEQPHTPLNASDQRYKRWFKRYKEFKAQDPDGKPIYYDNLEQWMALP